MEPREAIYTLDGTHTGSNPLCSTLMSMDAVTVVQVAGAVGSELAQ